MPRHRRVLSTCLVAMLACLLSAGVPDEDSECLRIAIAESRAVAHAASATRRSVTALRAFGTGREAYGTGIIVASEGLVLTALHVVDGATAIAVIIDGGEEFQGRIRAWDRSIDIALLEIVAKDRIFVPASLASDALDVGETVVAVSNPFGLGTSVTKGVLSAVGRRNVVDGQQAALLQTDAAINPGSSGGALVNLKGEVIGLITAIITRSGGHQGVGLAVPAEDLRRALERLSSGEARPHAWLGVRVLKEPVTGQGLRILEVTPEGPAQAAGIRDGDILKSLEGRTMVRLEDLRDALADAKAGDRLAAELGRKGETLSLSIQVGARD